MDKVNVELLIPLVKERPIIWDKTLPVYRNKPLRDKAWLEVCTLLRDDYKDLNKTQRHEFGKTVLKKWTQIRDSCCKYIKKRKNRKQFLPKPYKYFQELAFLEKISNISLGRVSETNDEGAENTDSEGGTSDAEDETEFSSCGEVRIYSEDEIPIEGSSGTAIKEESDRVINATPQNPYEVDDVMTKFLNRANAQKEDDPNLHFFKGILPIVSTLDTDEILQFQSGVLNLLQTIKKQRKTATQ